MNGNFVNGEWMPARSDRTFERRNPADTRDLIGLYADSGEEDVREAVEAARAALPSWRRLAPDADPVILTELAYLNQVYEEKFGFRFVVFVNRRPKAEILAVLRERLERTREEELDTALHELVAIAEHRWRRS